MGGIYIKKRRFIESLPLVWTEKGILGHLGEVAVANL